LIADLPLRGTVAAMDDLKRYPGKSVFKVRGGEKGRAAPKSKPGTPKHSRRADWPRRSPISPPPPPGTIEGSDAWRFLNHDGTGLCRGIRDGKAFLAECPGIDGCAGTIRDRRGALLVVSVDGDSAQDPQDLHHVARTRPPTGWRLALGGGAPLQSNRSWLKDSVLCPVDQLGRQASTSTHDRLRSSICPP